MSSNRFHLRNVSKLWILLLVIIGLFGVSLLLAWASSGFGSIQNWWPFLLIVFFGAGIMSLGWLGVKADKSFKVPKWLGFLIIGAALIRLLAGVIWFVGLPDWGYGSDVEQAGYIMADAHARDIPAWELAQTSKPLWTSITEYRKVDQYGGMIFLSALVYRYLGGDQHQPLQIIVLTASISSLAILFTWAFAMRVWGDKVAWVAAWVLAIFPDAIILGSSQMREAFLMTLVAVSLYGLVRFRQDRSWSGLAWLLLGLLFMLPFSPPIAGVFVIATLVLALSFEGWELFRQPRFWILIGGIAVIAGIGIFLAWGRIAPEGINDPISLVIWWFRQSARWQALFVKRSSTLIRKIFKVTPDWSHVPILMFYGVLQPFLPAAILDQGIQVWKGIAIWRSIGWTLMLPFLLVAPLYVWGRKQGKRLALGLTLVVWTGILIASLRSGGDLWDNPRYRLIFISMQAVLVAWVWFEQRQSRNPWLARMVIGLAIFLAWFVPWYLQRFEYISWPIIDIFKTIGLGITSVILVFIWTFVRGISMNKDYQTQDNQKSN